MDSIPCLISYKCYTEIRDGAVKRGCIGDENIPVVEKCSGPICKSCDEKINCNNEPVHVEKCIKCDSNKEDEEWCYADSIATDLKSEECILEAVQQGCFHHINDDGSMKRGCVNKLENDSELLKDCKSNSDTCKICHGQNCNFKKTFPKCLHCNYLEQTKCAIKPLDNKVISRLCASYMDECFTLIESRNVVRGCLSDSEQEQEDKEKCVDSNEMCAICDQANCNDKKIELERCIECDSDIDGEECRDNPQKFGGRICNGLKESQPEGCFLSIVGDHYKRGCISKLLPDEKINCLSQSNTCKSSFGTNSNSKISFLECYKCDSRDEPECSRKSTSNTRTEFCKGLNATCTTGIDDHGVTHRRCTRAIDEKSLKYHKVCNTAKCNSEIFPENRLQCYQCNGDDDCNLMPTEPNPTQTPDLNLPPVATPNAPLIWELTKSLEKLACNVLSKYDQCYTYIDDFGQMHRGCLTDPTDSRLLCELDDTICMKCKESGCNNQPKLRKPSLKCIHCTDDLECAYGQDKANSRACEKQVLFNIKESCYARSLSNGTHFDRGCTVDLMEKEPNVLCTAENNCSKCDTPDCNTQNIIQRSCLKCSSLTDNECIYGKGDKNSTALCDGEPYPNIKSGCYTLVKGNFINYHFQFENGNILLIVTFLQTDHHVERGCVKDLKEKYEGCLQETESCIFCESDNCNTDDHSSGHQISSTVLLNVFAIFFLFLYF